MGKFFDTLEVLVFLAAILCLFFLFQGEPDVWDRMLEKARAPIECAPVKKSHK